MKVWVVEQVEDHACGWVWGVYSSREKAEAMCRTHGYESVEISEHSVDDIYDAATPAGHPDTETG